VSPLLALGGPMRFASTIVRATTGAQLTVFIFHRVLDAGDPLDPSIPSARNFERLMDWLRRFVTVVPLRQAIPDLGSGRLPPRAAAITFDDGYADNATVAAPILQRLGMTATFFVSTGFIDGGRMWNDTVIESVRRWPDDEMDLDSLGLGRYPMRSVQERIDALEAIIQRVKYLHPAERLALVDRIPCLRGLALPDDLMMTSEQVRGLRSAGMSIGAHTVSHPILASTPPDLANREIVLSKAHLEALLQEPVELFAYPNGMPDTDYRREHVDMVRKAGFVGAVSTAAGVASMGSDPFELPRFTPWAREPFKFGLQLLANLRRTSYAIAVD